MDMTMCNSEQKTGALETRDALETIFSRKSV